MENVSEATANDTGVQASEAQAQQDKNDWQAIAQSKQSLADKYESLKSRFGDNFEDKLTGFSEFEEQWNTDKEETVKRLAHEAGIKINEPIQETSSQDDENVWEILQQGSKANKKLENEIASKAEEIAQRTLAKYKQEQQVNEWRQQLNNNGITDIKKQNEAIREFLNPNPDFNQFLKSKVSGGQPKGNQTPRPSDVMEQVSRNQGQPQSTGVLQGSMPPQKSAIQERVDAVMEIAKQKRGNENF